MNPERLWKALAQTTGGEKAYWFPLFSVTAEVPVTAYDIDRLCTEKLSSFQELLRHLHIQTVYDICRDDNSVCICPNLPAYVALRDEDGILDFPWLVEHYYFDDTHRWLLYVSHEGTIAFAGEALRDAAIASLGAPDWTVSWSEAPIQRFPCPCCGCKTFPVPVEDAVAYICPVCMWENDVFITSADESSDENHGMTLNQGRENWRKHGVCAPRLARYARAPRPEELPPAT